MPPSYSPCPRPCLKRSSHPHPSTSPANPPQDEPSTLLAIDPSILSPLVRFPPHTALAHTLGNALPYDRSPIVVLPNRCALPARGCPGRTYEPEEPSSSTTRRSKRTSISPVGGKHLHPRAVDSGHDPRGASTWTDDDPTPRQSPRVDYPPPLPPLIPDLSSESSEESDGVASPPPELYHSSPHGKMSLEQSLMNLTLAGTNAPSSSALSFLPHPPSPRVRPQRDSHSPAHSPSNSTSACYVPSVLSSSNGIANTALSNTNGGGHRDHYRTSTSPVRSRSPAPPLSSSPTHRRKARPCPAPIPIPSPNAAAGYSYPSSSPYSASSPTMAMSGVPASPERERERRSRHRDDSRRSRSRERRERERERAERLARYKPLAGFGVEDAGCLGGF